MCWPLTLWAQTQTEAKFERITSLEGLSNNQINCIFQDRQGFVWIGTLSGLNRFDGYEIKTYYHRQNDPTTIKNNTVQWMCYGPDNKIWVKNSGGISLYNANLGIFETADEYMKLLQTDEAFVFAMHHDWLGNSWFAIENRGLVRISANGEVTQYGNSRDADFKIASNNVTGIVADTTGNIWIVHRYGTVEVIDVRDGRVIRKYGLPEQLFGDMAYLSIFVDADHDLWVFSGDAPFGVYYMNTRTGDSRLLTEPVLQSQVVRQIVQVDGLEVWIGMDHGGIGVLNKKNWKLGSIVNDPDSPKSLINNNISVLTQDRNGIIWIGTAKNGVNYYHRGANNFSHFKYNTRDPAFNDLSSFAEDPQGHLWMGTNGRGLLHFNRKTQTFTSLYESGGFTGKMPEVIVSLHAGQDGVLWVGSYLQGLCRFDGKSFEQINFTGDASYKTAGIWEIIEDKKGNLWIGTLNQGAYRYNPKTGESWLLNDRASMNSNYVTCLQEDALGRIWLGSGNGLYMYHPEPDTFRTFMATDGGDAISNNSILSIHADAQQRIWVGTLDGLNLLQESGGFVTYYEKDGLSSNIIMSIEEDDTGYLWMSTSRGITRMLATDSLMEFQTFDQSDGLQGENFTEDASLKTRDGHLVFSGQNGFNLFKPDEITINMRTPELVFTRLSVGNEEVTPGSVWHDRVLLTSSLNETDFIDLKYDENSLSFEFVALSFFQSGKIRYQYMLEGFDNTWVNVSPDMRKAIYTNLDPGNYTFRVRCSGNQRDWSTTQLAMAVRIRPPFWETPLAFTIYTLMIFGILYLTRSYIVQREREKARRENERREAERIHQLDMMKLKFFTNVSHEFRTPLSLIVTPIERMIKRPDQIKPTELQVVQRNARRLMTLVNQLLDFRKMEANQHVLNRANGDLVRFMQDVVESFSDLSREKDIELKLVTTARSFFTQFDKDKMEKIMFNLLSNAFKFTLQGGKIEVDLELPERAGERGVTIVVADSGIGIAPDKLPMIFNRFFQSDVPDMIMNNGTGIGLSITKEFVELHGGHIGVESKPGEGTIFTVELPLEAISVERQVKVDDLVKELAQSVRDEVSTAANTVNPALPTVLLVEDNSDFRFYLKDNLKQWYNVTEAANGKEAWRMILNEHPDIVISDVMMPVMDGRQLCEKIKADPRTLHLPVILLTAQTSDQHKIAGLEAGAIEYITKPFNFEILVSSINSALKFQQRLQAAGSQIKAEPREAEIVSMDEVLIARAVELVEQNMSNSEFSVEDLSHELGYSRGHFYQKILKLTGQTPIDFIRGIRMKRASDLLLRSQLNVSEVAYRVGYNNPKLFSRYFRSQYKVYPSEYRASVGLKD